MGMSVYVCADTCVGYVHVHMGACTCVCVKVHVCTDNMHQCIQRPGINNRHLPRACLTSYFEAGFLKDGLVIMAGVQCPWLSRRALSLAKRRDDYRVNWRTDWTRVS